MDFLRSLVLIPENPTYLKGLEDIDEFTSPEDILKRKIKENPYNRDLIKRKLKKQKHSESPKQNKLPNRKFTSRVIPSEESVFDNGEKNYIKNLTGSPIMIITDEIETSGKGKGYPKAIQIREFIPKSELSEKELNNPQLLALYEAGKIIDVNHTEYKQGMQKVWEQKQRIQSIKEASIDRDIVDPINPVRGSASAGITRVGDRANPESIAEKIARGELYSEDAEHTINLSGAERGPSLERELGMIESSAKDDGFMTESEIRDLMRHF